MRSFVKIKSARSGEFTLSFSDEGKLCQKSRFQNPLEMVKSLCHLLMKVNHVIVASFYVANMSFNAIRENTFLANISEFTVSIHFPL